MTTFSGRVEVSEPLQVVTETMRTILIAACEENVARGKRAEFLAEATSRLRLAVSGDGEALTLAFEISRGSSRRTAIVFSGSFDGPSVATLSGAERSAVLAGGVEKMLADSGFTIVAELASPGLA